MSEASYLVELREAAPRAPEALRELVRELPPTKPARAIPPLRPLLVAGVGIAVAVAVGAAAISGIHGSRNSSQGASSVVELRSTESLLQPPDSGPRSGCGQGRPRRPTADRAEQAPAPGRVDEHARQGPVRRNPERSPHNAPARRLRRGRRLRDRLEHRLLAPRPSHSHREPPEGDRHFTDLGTILSQHISVADLQTGLDRLDARIATARKAGHKKQVTRLERRRAALVREGTYAKVALQLTTTKPAAKHVVPSRFDRFRDNAGDILGKEAIGVLYFLVIAGPFIFLAALALFGERARRRRADHRLLEETG